MDSALRASPAYPAERTQPATAQTDPLRSSPRSRRRPAVMGSTRAREPDLGGTIHWQVIMSKRPTTVCALLVATCVLMTMIFAVVSGADAQDVKLQNSGTDTPSAVIDPFLLDLAERTFRFFWDTANSENGLVPDRYPTPSYS